MKYERLTIVIPNGECRVAETKFNSEEAKQKAINRLAELEDKIEDGTLIELPCKVGDKFYEAFECTQEYYEYECCGFSVVDGRVEVINEVDSRYYADEVFFSKEEAEARLAELRGNA